MPSQLLECDKFLGLTELPLYSQPKGKLKGLQNFRVLPDGILEACGGREKLKPNGGTATAPIAGGFYTGAHEHNSPVGTIMRRSSAAAFTNNLSLQAYFDIFSDSAVGTRIYFISPNRFSRILFNIGTAGVGGYTVVWKYIDNAGVAQTLAGPTEDFKVAGERTVAFAEPATWGANSVNNVYGFVVYAETATAVIGTMPTQKDQRVFLNWQGMKEIYLASSNGASGTANGTIQRGSRDAGGTPAAVWTSITTSLSSASDPRVRFASWRGYLYWTNSVEQKRYNLDTVADVGFTAPTGAVTTAVGGGTGLTGLFHYAVTYGYGAAGELGESNHLQTTATVAPANQNVVVTLSGLTGVPSKGTVDYIYVYRSVDLSAVTLASSYGAFPFYRITTVKRDATGAFPATYTDATMAIPNPVKALDITVNTPPARCHHIVTHRSRMFYARNDQYPGRVWWSRNFEPESVNQDEDFADFTRSTGGVITKMIEFADQVIVHTEDATYGIANVDQEPPNVYVIAAGVGCIASEAGMVVNGIYIWPGRNGFYAWDGASQFDPDKNRISEDFPVTLKTLSLESHGGSRATAWRDSYQVTFITQANVVASMSRYDYSTSSKTWSVSVLNTTDVNMAGLLTFTAPLWHEDYGARHPLYGKVQDTGTDYHVYIGEFKGTDDGNAITYSATIHFGPGKTKVISPKRFMAISKGWAVANISLQWSNASYIGSIPVLGAVFNDGAQDYTLSQAQATTVVDYTGDLVGTFSVTQNSSSVAANQQYLLAAYAEGNVMDQPLRTN